MSNPFIPADTTLEAARVQYEVLRRMSPNRRLELAFQLSDALHDIAASGVRSRHPDYDETQVRMAVTRLKLGETLFRQAFPGVDVAV